LSPCETHHLARCPIVHGIVAFGRFGLGFFISLNQPWIALTIGTVLKAAYAFLVSTRY